MKTYFTLFYILIIGTVTGQVTNVKEGVWSDQTVWSNNLLPADTTNIILSYNIVVDVNAICKSLNTNGHNITVNAGITLNVVGDSTFTDSRDGQVYKFKHIGTQVWMTQNLNYNFGSSICADENEANCAIYGRLYTWADALIAAPPGWHLPSHAEWTKLVDYLGGAAVAGGKMKEAGTSHWVSPNIGADNSSGFTALPGGFRYYNLGPYASPGLQGFWWSTDPVNETVTWECYLNSDFGNVYIDFSNKGFYYSVRCIRD